MAYYLKLEELAQKTKSDEARAIALGFLALLDSEDHLRDIANHLDRLASRDSGTFGLR